VVLLVSSLRTSSSAAMKVKDEAEEPGKAIVAVVADKNWRSEASGREEQGPKGRLTNLSFDSL
jgi:hypothetical protein